jgi:hypothetical protein
MNLLNIIKWAYFPKTGEAKVDRIAKTLNRLAKHQKFYDK